MNKMNKKNYRTKNPRSEFKKIEVRNFVLLFLSTTHLLTANVRHEKNYAVAAPMLGSDARRRNPLE